VRARLYDYLLGEARQAAAMARLGHFSAVDGHGFRAPEEGDQVETRKNTSFTPRCLTLIQNSALYPRRALARAAEDPDPPRRGAFP
jgi:hypothetical protein